MLIIEFYNSKQKYVEKTDPFRYKDLKGQLEQAQECANVHSEISGWTFFESVGGELFPFQPFNRKIHYESRKRRCGIAQQ